ncbi:MAG: family 43 glycosylhydrolase [Verrucomicrobia bacterium]|nr:family 43 glycosylhydrolase [Verrucomicrobiota bacterium]
MKHNRLLVLLGLVASLAMTPQLMADYPIASHRYLADPTTLVTKDRVYIYCSNDDESPVQGSYNIPNVICVSSSDMKNWTDHGSVFRASDSTTWAKRTWAPAAIERDGKFFLYFGNGGANIGVATAPTPIGPFTDPLGKAFITHGTPGVQPARNMWLFDPGAFIDDDGQAYLYFGGNGDDNVRVAKLNRDMISIDGEVIKMNATNFFEAAWVFKIKDVYYFTYSTTPRAQMRIDYMTSKNPTNGFTYRGIVAMQPPLNFNDNNHSAQFKFKDRWYHVFHNRIVARQAGIPTGFRRNLGIEEFGFNADGAIKKVVYTTNGVAQIGHLNPFARVEGETFQAQSGVETEPCSEGGMNLTDLHNGDWVKVAGVDFGAAGAKRFVARVASVGEGGSIELRLGSLDGKLIGTCKVNNTGGSQTWKEAACEVSAATSVHDLYLKFTGGEAPLLNLDYWRFE